jgi:DNA-binding CsgD family transcriptional regulator
VELGYALRKIQRAVRADDRICPMGPARLAVEFGPVASGVHPRVLGERLARAVGQHLPYDPSAAGLAVSVGMAAPEQHLGPSDLTRRALSAAQAGSLQLGRRPFAGTHISNTVVTIDRLLTPRSVDERSDQVFQSVHRRSVYRYESGIIRGIPTLKAAAGPPGHLALADEDMQRSLTVLVVDPMRSRLGDPGIAAVTAAAVAERFGCRTAAVAVAVDDQLALAIDGVPLDAVVLVLDGGWAGRISTWSSSDWRIPAALSASYRAATIPVLAVSAGAGAGAVASCVAQGAVALFSLDRLPDALAMMHKHHGDETLPVVDAYLPPLFRALVGLTASERKVLYYLTEGWGAQEIAEELAVSLTTVRSHIRSVLRKLGVRSQLAAVAIANSRDLEHDESGEAS